MALVGFAMTFALFIFRDIGHDLRNEVRLVNPSRWLWIDLFDMSAASLIKRLLELVQHTYEGTKPSVDYTFQVVLSQVSHLTGIHMMRDRIGYGVLGV